MGDLFPNQSYGRLIYKHMDLPLYQTDEFDFYRCITFDENFYGKTVSSLHSGNLRESTKENRYAELFGKRKVSYWADSIRTARAETKYHNPCDNFISFWAYDDATSTFPILKNSGKLTIIDGREIGFSDILHRFECKEELSLEDKKVLKRIWENEPDCLAYESKRRIGGMNFLFFEKGFHKLALREVCLSLGDYPGRNRACIACAISSDYMPCVDNYGCYFDSIARVKMDDNYLSSEEYHYRNENFETSCRKIANRTIIQEDLYD